jgi:hypothetical protein
MARGNVHDLLEQQDEIVKRRVQFVLSPKLWKSYSDRRIKSWRTVKLRPIRRSLVPQKSGIYTLLVQPRIARHTHCSYLMYVGKAVNLKKRFGEYLNAERRENGRPYIYRLLNVYDSYVWFAFAYVPKAQLNILENRLIAAHLPPCNDMLPAKIRKAAKAF